MPGHLRAEKNSENFGIDRHAIYFPTKYSYGFREILENLKKLQIVDIYNVITFSNLKIERKKKKIFSKLKVFHRKSQIFLNILAYPGYAIFTTLTLKYRIKSYFL